MEYLTINECVKYLESRGINVSHVTIRAWISKGQKGLKLPSCRIGRSIYVRTADVDEFVWRLFSHDDHGRTTRKAATAHRGL